MESKKAEGGEARRGAGEGSYMDDIRELISRLLSAPHLPNNPFQWLCSELGDLEGWWVAIGPVQTLNS